MTTDHPASNDHPTGGDTPARRPPARRAARAVRQMGDTAVRAAVLRALADTVAAEHAAAREALATQLRAAYDGFRVKTIDVHLPGSDEPVATATLTATTPTTVVTDPAAQLAWVAEHHPDRLVTVVDPTYARQLLGELIDDPTTGHLVHGPTGTPAPWARRQPGGPAYPTLRFTPGGREQIITAWRAGRLSALAPEPVTGPPADATDPPAGPGPAPG